MAFNLAWWYYLAAFRIDQIFSKHLIFLYDFCLLNQGKFGISDNDSEYMAIIAPFWHDEVTWSASELMGF